MLSLYWQVLLMLSLYSLYWQVLIGAWVFPEVKIASNTCEGDVCGEVATLGAYAMETALNLDIPTAGSAFFFPACYSHAISIKKVEMCPLCM